jgi:hypothetical protein
LLQLRLGITVIQFNQFGLYSSYEDLPALGLSFKEEILLQIKKSRTCFGFISICLLPPGLISDRINEQGQL